MRTKSTLITVACVASLMGVMPNLARAQTETVTLDNVSANLIGYTTGATGTDYFTGSFLFDPSTGDASGSITATGSFGSGTYTLGGYDSNTYAFEADGNGNGLGFVAFQFGGPFSTSSEAITSIALQGADTYLSTSTAGSFNPSPIAPAVPEPADFGLFTAGLAGLYLARRKVPFAR